MTLRDRWNALSSRERALLGGAVVVALLVLLRYGLPGGDEEETGSTDAPWVQLARIESYRRVLSHASAVEKQTADIEARFKAQQDRLTAGATGTQVAAELQGRVSTMAADAGMNVLSSQILKEEEVDGVKRVGVRLTLSGEVAGVAKLVASVEGGEKDLVVSHLEVNRKLGAARRPTTPAKTETTTPALTVNIEVRTVLRQGT